MILKTIEEGKVLLRKFGIRESVFEPKLTGTDTPMFTEIRFDPAGTSRHVWSFRSSIEPFEEE